MNGAGRHAWQPESPKCLVKMINKWLSLLFSFLPLIKKKINKGFLRFHSKFKHVVLQFKATGVLGRLKLVKASGPGGA